MDRIQLNVESNNDQILTKVKNNARTLDKQMEWSIKFNEPLDPNTINSKNMYVIDSRNRRLDVSYAYDKETDFLIVKPIGEYKPNEDYRLVLTKKVKSVKGRYLKNEIVIKFTQKLVQDTVKSNEPSLVSKKPLDINELIEPEGVSSSSKLMTYKQNKSELSLEEKYGAAKLAKFKDAISQLK